MVDEERMKPGLVLQ